MNHGIILQTVVETAEFHTQATDCIEDVCKTDFINYIAANPTAGKVITGSGGARKIRWQSDEYSGKRGGVRIIYYYHDESIPIYLFTIYKKNRRDTLSALEKKMLSKIITLIVNAHRGKLS